MQKFYDRSCAGQKLAAALTHYQQQKNVVVLALARGGVPVGAPIAKHLQCPLDTLLVRKIGLPDHPECAMGAITHGGVQHLNQQIITSNNISVGILDDIIKHETAELLRRTKCYRNNNHEYQLKDKIIILVDDGIATGATIKAAIKAVWQNRAKKIIIATPVASKSTLTDIQREVDEIVCLSEPDDFYAVGQVYENFQQTTDAEVIELLHKQTYKN